MSIIVAVLVFGMIILIHEFGHFIVAKQCGIGVLEFSIGMGPRLFCVTRGETRYSIKIFPFGGSCMMLGEDENDKDPRAFNNKSVWARIAVIAAGPVFNFILAFFLALVIIHVAGHDAPRLTGVLDGMPAQEQGLEAGDLITKLNRERVVVYRDITMYMMLHPSDPVTVEYVRTLKDGRSETRTARLVPRYSEEYHAYMLGIQANAYREPVTGVADTVRYGAYEVVYWVKTAIKSIQMMFRRHRGSGADGQHHRRDRGGEPAVRHGDGIAEFDQSVCALKRQLRGDESPSHPGLGRRTSGFPGCGGRQRQTHRQGKRGDGPYGGNGASHGTDGVCAV